MPGEKTSSPIAIIGMACLFPEAEDLAQYWDNIAREVDCIRDVPSSRWSVEDYYDADPSVPDKTYCRRGGFIPEIDFDPTEFGLPPHNLEVTDVSQLLSLTVAKRAMEDAGYGAERDFDRGRVSVVLGVGGGQKLITPLTARLQAPIWRRAMESSGISAADSERIAQKIKEAYIPWEENAFPGLLGNVIAGRIASRLNLGGTNCVVDAACAASLGAAKMAIADLAEGRSDMALTGGVDADNSIFMYLCFSKTPALTSQPYTRPFDAEAQGTLLGEGVGMLVLKRLADARRDRDRVYAVIRGLGSSSDGRAKSIYSPRVDGQVQALERAYEDAGVAPETVSLIEAHGTGTRAGDVCEVGALKEVFADGAAQSIALGSIKAQIGHTKAAAGAAGLIKTALALHHKVLPPTLHVETPNPKLDIEASPFYLNTRARPWLRKGQEPLRAGVSSFGFGGTNFHVVLEEEDVELAESTRLQKVPQAMLLHAESRTALVAKCQEALAALEDGEGGFAEMAKVSRVVEIPPSHPRIGFLADSSAQARALLQATLAGLHNGTDGDWEREGIYYRPSALPSEAKIVALFPGQGAQYVEMGRELALNFAPMRQLWQKVDDLCGEHPVSRVVFPPPAFSEAQRAEQAAALRCTECAQPAIGAFSAGLYALLQQAGFCPDYVAGHSFGELTALWAAGVLPQADFLVLAKARGEAMASTGDAGAMLAVKVGREQVADLLAEIEDLAMANDNAPDQVVLAGPTERVAEAGRALKARGISSAQLPVAAAFHTPLVAHAQLPFAEALKKATCKAPQIPVYANATAAPYPRRASSIRKMLREHILHSVRFCETIERIYADGGHCFVEVGPKGVLTGLVGRILKDRPHMAVALNPRADEDSDRQLRRAVLQLRVAGVQLTDFDPQSAPPPGSVKKGTMNIRLSGNNYVSPETKVRFDRALQDGHQVQTPATATNSRATAAVQQDAQQQTQPQGKAMNSAPMPVSNPDYGQQLLASLAQFHALQAETLRVHEQFLRAHMEYAQTFFQLVQQQCAAGGQAVLAPSYPYAAPPGPYPYSAPPQQANFHVAPPPGPPAPPQHNPYMAPSYPYAAPPGPYPCSAPPQQANFHVAPPPGPPAPPQHNPYMAPPQSAPSAVVDPQNTTYNQPAPQNNESAVPQEADNHPPAPPGTAPGQQALDIEKLTQSMLKIVSEKTGYPQDVLDMDMDMEADLGIDSIKRVEILGAMYDAHLDLPEVNPEDLAELSTLAQIVDYMTNRNAA